MGQGCYSLELNLRHSEKGRKDHRATSGERNGKIGGVQRRRVRHRDHAACAGAEGSRIGDCRWFSCSTGQGAVAAMAELRWTGHEFFHHSDHVGASSCHPAQCVPDRCVASLCEWLLAARHNIRSLPHVGFSVLPGNPRSQDGGRVLRRDICFHRDLLLPLHPCGIPQTTALIHCFGGVYRQDLPQLYVWASIVLIGDVGGSRERASFVGHLYGAMDFLGYDDHERYARIKSLCERASKAPTEEGGRYHRTSTGRWRQAGRFQCACQKYRKAV